jgi:CheY-like chemotaxis protein/anti-sigma regulatory factor (Ser/Thr protein kinase)
MPQYPLTPITTARSTESYSAQSTWLIYESLKNLAVWTQVCSRPGVRWALEYGCETMKRVLVVEDSASQREALCLLLKRSSFEVTAAADGVEALEKILREKFDLLLVDVWMPRMNGLELLSQLPEKTRPKALVMTADDTAETLLQSLREKAYLFIAKPFDPKDLVQLIKKALESPAAPDKIQVVSAQPNWVELRFPCEMKTAGRIENVVDHLNSGLPPHVRRSLRLAFHELLMNAIEWGGHLDPSSQAQIDYLRTQKFLMCRIADPGRGFDPEGMDHADIADESEDPLAVCDVREQKGMRPGGYGIQLVKSLVDELVYNEAHNEVVMVKYLN